MPLQLIVVRHGWRLVRTAHLTLQEWQQLPHERRAELKGSMQRIGPLVVELTGSLRQRQARPSRSLTEITSELAVALGEVGAAAPELAPPLGPRTRRGRLAVKAAKSVGSAAARKASSVRARRALPEEAGLDEPGGDGELDAVAAAFAEIAGDATLRPARFDMTRPRQ